MKSSHLQRRNFLRYVAASSLVYSVPDMLRLNRLFSSDAHADEILDNIDKLIESADEAINVFEFAAVAEKKLT